MEVEDMVMEQIEQKQLIWYGHVRQMEDGRFQMQWQNGNHGRGGEETQNLINYLQVWSSTRGC